MDADLALFAKVVEAGSMSGAARVLTLSPAMVSKRIARLEARLGVRLLARTTRKLEPTARGRRFYEDIVALLEKLAEAEDRVTDQGPLPSGSLRITAPTSFGRMHLTPCLKPFLDLYPEIELALDLSDGFSDLLREDFDLAIRISSSVPPTLVAHRLAGNRRVLCAAPSYLATYGRPEDVGELRMHRLLAAEGQMPWKLIGPQGHINLDAPSHVRTNSSEVVRELTIAGVGIALRSLWDVGAELAAGHLEPVLPQISGSMDTAIFAVHPRSKLSSAGRALLVYLQQQWRPSAQWE